jgi:hypothetical protein
MMIEETFAERCLMTEMFCPRIPYQTENITLLQRVGAGRLANLEFQTASQTDAGLRSSQ